MTNLKFEIYYLKFKKSNYSSDQYKFKNKNHTNHIDIDIGKMPKVVHIPKWQNAQWPKYINKSMKLR